MFLYLLLLFTVLPIVEISLLIQLGESIGWAATLLIALGTGVLGASLAKAQGIATLARIQQEFAAGRAPADALVDGAMILVAAAVLVTPGVLTDAFGFCLLIPPIRAVLKPLLRAAFARAMKRGSVRVWTNATPPPPQAGEIVDAEVLEVRTRDAE